MEKLFEDRITAAFRRVDARNTDALQYSVDGGTVKIYFYAGFVLTANVFDNTGRLCCFNPHCAGGEVSFDNTPSVLEYAKKEIARTRVWAESKAYEKNAIDIQCACDALLAQYKDISTSLMNSWLIMLDIYEPSPLPAKIRTVAYTPSGRDDVVKLTADVLQRIGADADDVEHIRVGENVVITLKTRHVITCSVESDGITLRSPCIYCPDSIGVAGADMRELNLADELNFIKHAVKIERYVRRYGENHALYMRARHEKDRLESAVHRAECASERAHWDYYGVE
jgi:hypothetical protein